MDGGATRTEEDVLREGVSPRKTARFRPRVPASRRKGVSALVVTRNDAYRMDPFFDALARSSVREVLVCDLDSEDGTAARCRQAGASVFRCSGDGRRGLRKTADRAGGKVLWFLSPACLVPEHGADMIAHVLVHIKAIAGCFLVRPVRFTWPRRWRTLRWNWSARWRGPQDLRQGPFLPWPVYEALGGLHDSDLPDLFERAGARGRLYAVGDPILLDM